MIEAKRPVFYNIKKLTMAEETKITRLQLRFMRDITMEFSKSKNANQNWKKHLIDLSNECDTLDAVMCRANIKEMILEGKKINRVLETEPGKN